MPDNKTTPTPNSDGQPIVKPSPSTTTPQQTGKNTGKTADSNGQPIVKP